MSRENGRVEERKMLMEQGIDVDLEVKRIYEKFLLPRARLLADNFRTADTDHIGISVRTRTASFITTPCTTVGAIPEFPCKDASLFWLIVVDDAKKFGFTGDYFPKKCDPYIFNFTHYLKDDWLCAIEADPRMWNSHSGVVFILTISLLHQIFLLDISCYLCIHLRYFLLLQLLLLLILLLGADYILSLLVLLV